LFLLLSQLLLAVGRDFVSILARSYATGLEWSAVKA
jgi:hypothetical protein